MSIAQELTLFAAASERNATQWDGTPTPKGVLLRWILSDGLGFPPHGFEVYRGAFSMGRFKLHRNAIPSAIGDTRFELDSRTSLFSTSALDIDEDGIVVSPGQSLVIGFSKPVSVLELAAGRSGTGLQVKLVVGGQPYDEKTMHPSHELSWGTRGINTAVISGDGVLSGLATSLVEGPYKWEKIADLGLPLAHPNYPHQIQGDDFTVARDRLPSGADWNGLYKDVFTQLHEHLTDMFEGSTEPFPPPGQDADGPTLRISRRAALFLAMLDPNVARMLGYAFDDQPGNFPRDDYLAYRVDAIWNADPAHRDIRSALFPAAHMREAKAYVPENLKVSLDESVGRPRAGLRWTPVPPFGITADPPTLRYQAMGRRLADLADTPPTSFELGLDHLLFEDPLLLPADATTTLMADPFVYQRLGRSGHWAHGVRGVDVFGRVSDLAITLSLVDDKVRPPPPFILDATYLQSEMPATSRTALSREARAWMGANPGGDAFEVVWSWPPELADRAPDVDRFEVHVRLPVQPNSSARHEAEIDWASAPWGGARVTLGPVVTRHDGAVTDARIGLPKLAVTDVEPLGADTARLRTDLSLVSGRGALGRCSLRPVSGGDELQIMAHGEGAALSLVVSTAAGAVPVAGDFELLDPDGRIVSLQLTLDTPGNRDPHQQGGHMAFDSGGRMKLLGQREGRVLGLIEPAASGGSRHLPNSGEACGWYPDYRMVFEDTGFGPQPSPDQPLAQAQLSVRSLRPPSPLSGQRTSPPSSPHTVAATDYSRPIAPLLPELPSGPRCAELASAADYYGISKFTLDWPTKTNERYAVYRVLRDALLKADHTAQSAGADTHNFPASWLPDDPTDRDLVQREISELDQALAGGDQAAIDQAYDALGAESVRLIASQDVLRPAFTALQGKPLEVGAAPYTDEFDGRPRGSWVYRVAAFSIGGLEGGWSMATPPICAPDVVAPPPPQIQEILAVEGAVVIRWLRSPARDLSQYRLYRSLSRNVVSIHDMEEVALVAIDPAATLAAGQLAPTAVDGQSDWLEMLDPLEGGAEAHYRLVAEDTVGNRSFFSAEARGRALRAQPAPPVWGPPVRNGDEVALSWAHPVDDRLSCRVEKRGGGQDPWMASTGWLPRGVYEFTDFNPLDELSWEYRLSVRDHIGLVSQSRPVVRLAANPVN